MKLPLGVRLGLVFTVAAVTLHAWPGLIRPVVAPWIPLAVGGSCPYIEDARMTMEGKTITIDGVLRIRMTLQNGGELPPVPGSWTRQADRILVMATLALTVFAAPALSWRRRLLAVPVLWILVGLVSAAHLAVETQETALRVLGESWLASQPLAPTAENVAYFKAMESWYDRVLWGKSFLDGGGGLFLAVLAGLAGPLLIRPRTGAQTG